MADKVSRRLSYDPTPNMAGIFADSIPAAPAPIPAGESPPSASYEAPAHATAPIPEFAPKRATRPAPRAAKAPKTARPAARKTARAKPVVSSEQRTRRTLRIPKSFDRKLRELASFLGVNLNSAILAAIEAEWQRRVTERRRA